MNFTLFAQLYFEALDYDNFEMYAAERGWQDWMDDFTDESGNPDRITNTLHQLYSFANTPLQEIRKKHGLSRAEACRIFRIPVRTFEDWERKESVPEYTKCLICYVLHVEATKDKNLTNADI